MKKLVSLAIIALLTAASPVHAGDDQTQARFDAMQQQIDQLQAQLDQQILQQKNAELMQEMVGELGLTVGELGVDYQNTAVSRLKCRDRLVKMSYKLVTMTKSPLGSSLVLIGPEAYNPNSLLVLLETILWPVMRPMEPFPTA